MQFLANENLASDVVEAVRPLVMTWHGCERMRRAAKTTRFWSVP